MFQGTFVAIVTPFLEDGSLDETGLRRLVDFHVQAGTTGLVPCGTTGENPTFTLEEHTRVVRTVVEAAAGRLRVVAGAGSNDTKKTILLAEAAEDAGADGLLVITPYYNRPQPEGLIRHFRAVAASVSRPIMLYNVPSRTGVNMLPETVEQLADVPNIAAIKEASGNVNQTSEIVARCGDRMHVLAGDDSLALPIIAVGGKGVVSVIGNAFPGDLVAMIDAALEGRWDEARRRHLLLYEISQAMFVESNPAPIKFLMQEMGRPVGAVRPPLAPLRPSSEATIRAALERYRGSAVSRGA